MRSRAAAVVLASVLTGCARLPATHQDSTAPSTFTTHHLPPTAAPSPLALEVVSGQVEGMVPDTWDARPLPPAHYPREGFVASPSIEEWERGAGTVRGTEAFWIDVADVHIPSDYYYLVARGPAVGPFTQNKTCQLTERHVYVDRRPDFTGERFSPGDYVASARGVCGLASRRVRWEYVVIEPGYGPIRDVGIPTSGLYVVLAAVSGPRWQSLLSQLIGATRFHNTPISRFVDAARNLA